MLISSSHWFALFDNQVLGSGLVVFEDLMAEVAGKERYERGGLLFEDEIYCEAVKGILEEWKLWTGC